MRIADQLADVGRLGGFFAIGLGPGFDGWRPVSDCYADGFADLLERTAARNGDRRVSASLVQMGHATRLWSPALACAVIHGVAPDFADLRRAPDTADLAVPEPTGTPLSSDRAQTLYRVVVERHLEPLAAALPVRLASGLLYGNITSAMVGAARALYMIRPSLRDDATRLARELLATGRLAGTGTVSGNLAFRRRSCCLYYRIADGAKCGDCALR